MTITDIQDEIIDDFSLFETKDDKYNYIIELGKALPPLDEAHRVDANLIKGCQSKVWLTAKVESGRVVYMADSDSVLVKGLVSLLLKVFSNRGADEILTTEPYFIEKIGLHQMLSMNRANGLSSMLKQLKMYALAFKG